MSKQSSSFVLLHNKKLNSASSSCCGPRHSSNLFKRPDSYYERAPPDNNRYLTKFGDRIPVDRYGWQPQGQSSGTIGNVGRPNSGSHPDSSFFEGSQNTNRFGSRPSYGSEGSRRPGDYDSGGFGGGYGHGGYAYSRPTGFGGPPVTDGYGISGTFDNGDEFSSLEPSYPEEQIPPNSNLQRQKAIALKALAGVALLGAAAALATNPVLLPLGIVAGRRKRSILCDERNVHIEDILQILRNKINATKNFHGQSDIMSFSPTCITRLACEIQKCHSFNMKNDDEVMNREQELEHHLINLLSKGSRNGYLNAHIKMLIKHATTALPSSVENCSTFTCTATKSIHL